jgi:glycine/D-amino acid oxidase-like deaminating enzyme
MNTFDTIIIGGGFYGLRTALFLYEELNVKNILIIEKEVSPMTRASYVNQARVHNGYHYPRSVLTAYRSRVNFTRFVDEYRPAIVDDFTKYYAIARGLSKVNAKQFKAFCEKIEAEIAPASQEVMDALNENLIEDAFTVKEYAFNSHILRDVLLERISHCPGIEIHTNEEVDLISEGAILAVKTNKATYTAPYVLNCTYAQINNLHRRSGIPLVPLKHEITEMCLVKLPESLKDFSITVMDGPFFSIMPFPTTPYHTLSHVRYTPHMSWNDDENTSPDRYDTHRYYAQLELQSNYRQMYADVVRYVPSLKDMTYARSISDVKTVLRKSEGDDSRPILFKPHYGFRGYTCIMGGKLDNIYDVFLELEELYGQK